MSDAQITIPADLLPADGRFGSGPSKVRPAQVEDLTPIGRTVLGTSHRQAPVKNLVKASPLRAWRPTSTSPRATRSCSATAARPRSGTSPPSAWSATARSTSPSASSRASSPPSRRTRPSSASRPSSRASPGSRPDPRAEAGVDVYAWAHNETQHRCHGPGAAGRRAPTTTPSCSSTPRPAPAACPSTSAETDVYYFAPQKSFASDGGLWLAAVLPRRPRPGRGDHGIRPLGARLLQPADGDQQQPPRPDLQHPGGRAPWRCSPTRSSGSTGRAVSTGPPRAPRTPRAALYDWAEASEYATPYVTDPANRSQVVATIDFDDSIDAAAIAKTLRANGVVDVEPYRKLGRNQLRVACFPAVEPDDVSKLIGSVEYVVDPARPDSSPSRLRAGGGAGRMPVSRLP